MAKISEHSLIHPEGKLGGFTFYKLRGKTIMRSLPTGPHKNKTNPSKLQQVYQRRLTEINAYLRPLSRVLDFGYQNYLDQKSGVNWAHTPLSVMGYNHEATPRINPAFLQISKGTLLGLENVGISKSSAGIRITWTDNSKEGNASEGDNIMVLLNHPDFQKHVWIQEAARRRDLELVIPPIEGKEEFQWEVYLSVHRIFNRKKTLISDSVYLGRV